MRYYDGLYSTVAAAEASGSPTRKWVLKTDEDGYCELDPAYIVSGDALYLNSNGRATLPVGTVLIHETKAPKGYFLNDEVYLIKIAESSSDAETITTYNAPITPEQVLTGNIQITKTTRTGLDKHVVPENGAVFQIYLKSAGSYAAAAATDRALLTTDANGVATAKNLPYGTYTVHQVSGRAGSALCADFNVTINTNGKTYSYEIENERFYSEVQLMKLDSRTCLLIPEANVGFQIKYPNGSLVSYNGADTWYTNSEGVLTLPMELEYGKGYQAIEVSAPDGYVLSSSPIKFDVTADAATTVGRDTVILVNVNNTPTSVEVSKTNVAGSGVFGATLQVLNDSGRVVDEWTSDGTVHMIYGLSIGGHYTLHEKAAPAGYVLAKDVAFTVADTTDTQPVSMIDKQVFIEKLDAEGNAVSGATLQILDAEGNVVDAWVTDGKPHAANNLVIGESYTLRETSAPAGYVRAEDIPFDVTLEAENRTVSMTNKQVLIEKLDEDDKFVTGAKLQILNADGYVVDEWITDGSAHAANNLVIGENYTLHEIETPEGYVTANDVSFTVATTSATQTVSMIDKRVFIEKVDVNNTALSGAKMQVLDAAGNIIDEWISDGTPHAVSNLLIGESYTLHEAETPEGYVTANDVSFTVELTPETQTITMIDMQVFVRKVTASDTDLPNAQMQVLDTEGNVVDEWTTDGTAHAVIGLAAGEHYVIHEAAAPTGYVCAADQHFTVEDDGKNQSYTVIDKQVLVEKVTATGTDLPDAKLQVLDTEGNVVDEWVSDGTPHSVSNLLIGKDYILHEAETPEGYVHANDVPFTVAVKAETQTVSMIDKRLLIEKIDPYGNPVAGAVLQVLDEQGAVIDEWVSDGTSYAAIGLEAGKSYILREDEAPDGWLLSYDLPFTVEDDGLDQTVRFENEEIPLLRSMATVDERHEAFAKADITLNDVVMYEKLVPSREYVMEGTLLDKDTGKPLEDKEGNPLTSSVTFTPSESSGSIIVPFTYTPIAGSTVVVYQQIYKNDRLLASHEDIEDENQTVHFPSIDSSATVNEKKEISCTSEMTLVDIVYYQNLEVGKEYTVTGLLMDKRTGEAYAAKKDAEPITASATFTPEAANGSVSLTFALTSSQFSRTTTLVVFDELYDGDYLVAEHEDIEDEDQTVEIRIHYGSPEEVDPADSGDTGIALYVALANISYIGSCLLIRQRRERK